MNRPFVIVGAGALGQSFAALLAASGQHVTVVATHRTAERLRRSGRILLRGVVDLDLPITQLTLTSDPTDVAPCAVMVFTTKGQDLAGAVQPLARSEPFFAAGVQNGIVKDDVLAAVFGAERVVAAATIFGANRQEDGTVRVMGRGMTYFGEPNGEASERVHAATDAFVEAGVPAEARTDIASVLWSKACNATGVFGICVLARATNPQLFSDPDLMRAYLTLVRETAAVAAACGAPVGNYAGFPPIATYAESDEESILSGLSPRPVEAEPSYASMTQDLLAGRAMEVDSIFADIVERADQHGIAVPCLRFTRDVLRGLNHERMLNA